MHYIKSIEISIITLFKLGGIIMNSRTLKTSKSNVIKYHFRKYTIHDIVLKNPLNLSKNFVNGFKSILNWLLTPTSYVYDEASDTCKPCNDNYYFRDTTNLKLKASQRTFL